MALALLPTTAVGSSRYVPHVRVRHAVLQPLLHEAIEKSATTRAMVAALDASDVFVYFELMTDMRHRLPAGLSYAGSGGRFRYLRISLNPMNTHTEMITMIGHELQHAVEIASEPTVRTRRDLEKFYSRIGMPNRARATWDTEAARQVGRQVQQEARNSRK
jgi:hypothetical protein